MRTTTLTLATNDLITTYGNTAKNVINAYRVGNARAASYVEKTWSAAVQKAGKRISGEVRRNALNAQKKLTGYYVQGVTFTTDGADAAVDKAVELATRIASNAPLTNYALMHALPRIAEQPADHGFFTEALMSAIVQDAPEAKARVRDFLEGRGAKVKKG